MVACLCIGFAAVSDQLNIWGSVTAEPKYQRVLAIDLIGDPIAAQQSEDSGVTVAENTITKRIELYGHAEQRISFQVQNYIDDLRFSKSEVTYTIKVACSVSDYQAYTLERHDGATNVPVTTEQSYTFTPKTTTDGDLEKADPHKYTLILPEAEEANTMVTVTVTPTDDRLETLVLQFVLKTVKTPAVSYRIVDSEGDLNAVLIIRTEIRLEAGALTVQWPENALGVDLSNNYVLGKDEPIPSAPLTTFAIQKPIEAPGSIEVFFFKENVQSNYSTNGTEYVEVTKNGEQYLIEIKQNTAPAQE